MDREYYTVIIASNRGDSARKLVISMAWLKAGAFLCGAALLLVLTASVDYVGLLSKADEHRQLLDDNISLKDRSKFVEKRLSAMLADLSRTHRLTTKLKIITNRQNDLVKLENDLTQNFAGAPMLSGDEEIGAGGGERAPASEPTVLSAVPFEPLQATPEIAVTAAADLEPTEMLENLTLSERVDGALQESQLREQELMDTWGALSDRQSLLSAMPSVKPAQGYYSSLFGYRFDPINGRPLLHAGLDIAAPWGTPVMAPADGVVSFAGYEGGYGNLVAIDHGYGVTTRFGHNSRIFVHQGQHVHRWEVISAVGSTGHSTGAHVHYEVRVHGLPVNPANYILQEN